jgi:hypothetical protein
MISDRTINMTVIESFKISWPFSGQLQQLRGRLANNIGAFRIAIGSRGIFCPLNVG